MCRPGRTTWGLPFFGTTARSAVLSEGSLYSQYTAGFPGNAGIRNVLFPLIMVCYPNLFTSLFVSLVTHDNFTISCYPNSALSSVMIPLSPKFFRTPVNREAIASPLLEYIQNVAHYLCVIHSNDGMQVITLDIGDVLYTTQQLNYIVLKHVNGVHINSSSRLFIKEIDYIYSNVDGNH